MENTRSYRTDSISIPEGGERAVLLDSLSQLTIDGNSSGELRDYLEADLDRFLYTLALVPESISGTGLEIGANPYFMSVLAREYRSSVNFDYLNYFEGAGTQVHQRVGWLGRDGRTKEDVFTSRNVNLELEKLPVDGSRYDQILFCEVLEHFTMNPLHWVLELRRVLKDDGLLVLTTPNVARFENVCALIEGRNLYDPYSGYGPHGWHNREYTRHELHMLMRHAGFVCDFDFTSDVHPNIPLATDARIVVDALAHIPRREHDLGQYLFSRWRKEPGADPAPRFPSWLYRSYPESHFA